MTDVIRILVMFAAFALIGTGLWMLSKQVGTRFKATLMILAGVVMILNVWISSLPMAQSVEATR